ncbi:transglutaminase domain-containing protein [Wenjunlia tyrosinilytica]|uniref:Transglutaminase-like domain-containing protein n=1 Tax=Wenjunlia tyrosinilytica TaxID=1544741 RepID=A0A918DZP4_9ACTN|nr:hypothetical protein [Wenjunlia tyrosinilytica]GGO96024.1 hypothetical protein GCM10012280_54600 [Wenjunlia tyrosinilytica]
MNTVPTTGRTVAGYGEGELRAVLETVFRVPDAHRNYRDGSARAREVYGIDAALLETLLSLGLPHRVMGGELLFERTDLHNISMALRIPSPYFISLQTKARSLKRAADRGMLEYGLRVSASCPDRGHPGPCEYVPAPELEQAATPDGVSPESPTSFTARVRLPGHFTIFDGQHAELLRLVSSWRLHILPKGLSDDLGFAQQTGLSNCVLATRLLLAAAEEHCIEARQAAGLLVSPPFATVHWWLEFRIDGAWLPADPLLLKAFADWRMLDAAEWPQHRSPSGVLMRFHSTPRLAVPIVRHHGVEATTQVTARDLL